MGNSQFTKKYTAAALRRVMCTPDAEPESYDERPLVKDLLKKHGKAIASVREKILADEEGKALYEKADNAERYDEIWILRFVLSHKGSVKAATKAALSTIRFREEKKVNELGDIRHRLKNCGIPDSEAIANIEPLPGKKLMEKFCGEDAVSWTQPYGDRGPVMYCDIGQLDQHGIVEGINEEEMKEMAFFVNEAVYQILDETTRRTGRLTKLTKVVDMGTTSFRQMNRTYIKRDAACSKALEDYHPQLLGCMLICNSPSWLSGVWAVLKPFFPKRVVEKIDFLPSSKGKGSKKASEAFLKYVSEENLPERYGGMNKEWPLPCASERYVPK